MTVLWGSEICIIRTVNESVFIRLSTLILCWSENQQHYTVSSNSNGLFLEEGYCWVASSNQHCKAALCTQNTGRRETITAFQQSGWVKPELITQWWQSQYQEWCVHPWEEKRKAIRSFKRAYCFFCYCFSTHSRRIRVPPEIPLWLGLVLREWWKSLYFTVKIFEENHVKGVVCQFMCIKCPTEL